MRFILLTGVEEAAPVQDSVHHGDGGGDALGPVDFKCASEF